MMAEVVMAMEVSAVGGRLASSVLNGLTSSAPEPSVCAAPTNSERMRTPLFFCWHAMYSKAISHLVTGGKGRASRSSARKDASRTCRGP